MSLDLLYIPYKGFHILLYFKKKFLNDVFFNNFWLILIYDI